MADSEAPPEAESGSDNQNTKATIANRLTSFFRTSRGLALLIAATITVQVLGFWYIGHLLVKDRADEPHEISLGTYEYVGDHRPQSSIAEASFDLHISLVDELDEAARTRLKARRFKVEQDIEQLLRQAHEADFEDPTLAELKRQLQELINQSLEMQAVSEVIITNLSVDRVERGELIGSAKGDSATNDSG